MNKRILISSLTGLILGLMFSFSAAANTSVQSNHTAANNPAIETSAESIKIPEAIGQNDLKELELKLQEKILATHQKAVDNQQENTNWWLTAIALLGLILPYMFYQKEREHLVGKFESALKEAKEYSTEAQKLLKEIQKTREQAEQEIAGLQQKISEYNPEKQSKEEQQTSINAAEKLSKYRDIPIIEQLRAQAILLSDRARKTQNYQDHLQAFYAWQAVLQQDNQDEQANSRAGLQASYLHEKSSREQQIHWLPEIEKYYQQTLKINPYAYGAANNWGNALNNEAQALASCGEVSAAFEKWRNVEEKYQLALDIKPNMHEALYNWGNTLHSQAQALATKGETDAASEKWQNAEEKYRLTLNIKPDLHKAMNNWLICLFNEYQLFKAKEPAKSQAKLEQARNLVNDFLSKNPQHKEKLAYNHACLCALEGNTVEAIKQLRLAQHSNHFPNKEHIEQDDGLDNIRHTPEFQAWFKEAFPESSSKS